MGMNLWETQLYALHSVFFLLSYEPGSIKIPDGLYSNESKERKMKMCNPEFNQETRLRSYKQVTKGK